MLIEVSSLSRSFESDILSARALNMLSFSLIGCGVGAMGKRLISVKVHLPFGDGSFKRKQSQLSVRFAELRMIRSFHLILSK